MRRAALLTLVAVSFACAHASLPGTDIPDTADNRAVFDVVEALRKAMTDKDAAAVMALVSPSYFEDMGTPDPGDDYGYTDLRDKVLPELLAAVQEMQLAFEVYEIVVEGDRAHVDVRYSSRAKLEVAGNSQWASKKEFDRIAMVRDGDAWRIISGL